MLWTPPALPSAWNPSQKGVQHSAMELRPQLSATSSYTLWLQFGLGQLQKVESTSCRIFLCASQRSGHYQTVKKQKIPKMWIFHLYYLRERRSLFSFQERR
ncbi:uncharacterized protein LOC116115270 [Pistacia vera]|uniref:uncharacterized protein LOC116115270 n=1 Tax=Pistacia vera TaxID=55513 RepID=UPI0012631F0A|nr:uncharacterized protein LOC116115270 [Pistacia vera]